jgi:hypothetical protein
VAEAFELFDKALDLVSLFASGCRERFGGVDIANGDDELAAAIARRRHVGAETASSSEIFHRKTRQEEITTASPGSTSGDVLPASFLLPRSACGELALAVRRHWLHALGLPCRRAVWASRDSSGVIA